jgi:carbonic anhydrase
VLNKEGRVIRSEEVMTPERRRAKDLQDEKKREEAAAALEQQRHDKTLINIYSSADEIDLARIRNVANLVPPAENQGHYHGTSAALEFGVRNLAVQHIIVLGHAQCGGIHALLEGGVARDDTFISEWMTIADAAREQIEREFAGASSEVRHRACEQQAILVSLNNLMTFSWIRERVEQGSLALHGWYFDIERGELLGYNETARQFEAL